MRRATELLARLEKHALDEQRIALEALETALSARRHALEALERNLATQHLAAWALPGGPRHLAGYAAKQIELQRGMLQDARNMVAARDLASEALRTRLQSYQTMNEADRRCSERAARQAFRRDQIQVEEACALRLAHDSILGPVAG